MKSIGPQYHIGKDFIINKMYPHMVTNTNLNPFDEEEDIICGIIRVKPIEELYKVFK